MQPADLTLSAGPNDVFPEVRAAMGGPVLYHYDPVFKERFRAAEAILGRKHVTVWLDRETYEYLAAFKIGGESVGVRAAAQHFVKYGIARHQEAGEQ